MRSQEATCGQKVDSRETSQQANQIPENSCPWHVSQRDPGGYALVTYLYPELRFEPFSVAETWPFTASDGDSCHVLIAMPLSASGANLRLPSSSYTW